MTITDAQLDAFKAYSTALVTDAMRRLKIRDAWPNPLTLISHPAGRMVGRARIINYAPIADGPKPAVPGQFDILAACAPGDVLLYAACGVDAWLIGDNVASLAAQRGLAGLAVDGGARDLNDLRLLALPIYARGATPKPYSDTIWPVAVDQPAVFAGARVSPGDVVVGDQDGIAIVPAAQAASVLYELEDLDRVEADLAAAIARQADVETLNRLASRKAVLRKPV